MVRDFILCKEGETLSRINICQAKLIPKAGGREARNAYGVKTTALRQNSGRVSGTRPADARSALSIALDQLMHLPDRAGKRKSAPVEEGSSTSILAVHKTPCIFQK